MENDESKGCGSSVGIDIPISSANDHEHDLFADSDFFDIFGEYAIVVTLLTYSYDEEYKSDSVAKDSKDKSDSIAKDQSWRLQIKTVQLKKVVPMQRRMHLKED